MINTDNMPYGDIFTDDDGMEQFLKDRDDKYKLCKMMREECVKHKLSKEKFKEWFTKASSIGDDEPLSKFM